MKGTLNYNQGKVNKQKASILEVFNVPGGTDPNHIRQIFEWYERANIRTDNVSFQMSINPDPDRKSEELTDGEAVSYAKTLMDGLGYGNQPIVVYKHQDIERTHYHVVSIRTNEEGRKIRDSFEKENIQRLMAANARKYHYVIGNQGSQEEKGRKAKPDLRETIPAFNPTGSNVRQQYSDLFEEAMTYNFKTPSQFADIMRSFGVETEIKGPDGEFFLTFQGLDANGEKAGVFITEKDLEEPLYKRCHAHAQACSEKKKLPREEWKKEQSAKNRAAFIVSNCIKYSKSEEHLTLMLAKKGVTLSPFHNASGELFGANVVDHTAKKAWKLSELDRELTAVLKETARPETGRWDAESKLRKEEWIERRRSEKRQAHIQSNMDLAAKQEGPREPGTGSLRESGTDWLSYAVGMLEMLLTGKVTITRSVMNAKKRKKKETGKTKGIPWKSGK